MNHVHVPNGENSKYCEMQTPIPNLKEILKTTLFDMCVLMYDCFIQYFYRKPSTE